MVERVCRKKLVEILVGVYEIHEHKLDPLLSNVIECYLMLSNDIGCYRICLNKTSSLIQYGSYIFNRLESRKFLATFNWLDSDLHQSFLSLRIRVEVPVSKASSLSVFLSGAQPNVTLT